MRKALLSVRHHQDQDIISYFTCFLWHIRKFCKTANFSPQVSDEANYFSSLKFQTKYDVEVLDKFDGDIILDRADIDHILDHSIPSQSDATNPSARPRATRVKRKMAARETKYWTGEIPWKIQDSSFSECKPVPFSMFYYNQQLYIRWSMLKIILCVLKFKPFYKLSYFLQLQ